MTTEPTSLYALCECGHKSLYHDHSRLLVWKCDVRGCDCKDMTTEDPCTSPVISHESWGGGDVSEVACGECEACRAAIREESVSDEPEN